MPGPLPSPTARGRSLARDLAAIVGSGSASCEPLDLWASGQDAWSRSSLWLKAGRVRNLPDVVVWPRDQAQVAQIVEYASERLIPVVPVGGQSSACGAAQALRGGIALDLKRLAAAPRIDLPGCTVDVRAGVNGTRLEEQLAAVGATLGHFPADRGAATVGGWMATRSGGTSAGRYGKIEDLVLELEAVDGTGATIRTIDGPTSGPDLIQLLLGSEGTMCVFTSARLRIYPRPAARWRRAVRFDSLGAGLAAAQKIVRGGLRPSRLELHDPASAWLLGGGKTGLASLRPALARAGARAQEGLRFLLRSSRWIAALAELLPSTSLLLLEFEAHGPDASEQVEEEGEEALRLCAGPGNRGRDLGAAPAGAALSAREGAFWPHLLGAGSFIELLDVAATWERLEGVLAVVRRAVGSRALVLARLSHAWPEGGTLDLQLVGPPGLPMDQALSIGEAGREEAAEAVAREVREAEACLDAALAAAIEVGATLSAHRGVGLARALHLPRELGEGMRPLRALKRAFDPRGVLNPGKLLL
jgi:alkyldihydroxyacetonephosphate synthase